METFNSFKSSNVKSLAYEPKSGELTVEFKNGGRYAYEGVTAKRWHNLKNAKSKGSFVAAKIAPLGGRKLGAKGK